MKYEFTSETLDYRDGHILHQICRISDGKVGGWIEEESWEEKEEEEW